MSRSFTSFFCLLPQIGYFLLGAAVLGISGCDPPEKSSALAAIKSPVTVVSFAKTDTEGLERWEVTVQVENTDQREQKVPPEDCVLLASSEELPRYFRPFSEKAPLLALGGSTTLKLHFYSPKPGLCPTALRWNGNLLPLGLLR